MALTATIVDRRVRTMGGMDLVVRFEDTSTGDRLKRMFWFDHVPSSAEEDARVTEAIEAAGVGVLFVGLGCPKQERWMAAHRGRLACAQIGVGAAFDFLAGTKPQAPRWVMRAGLEWLFRLACEPRRLWRRYLIGNVRFLYHFLLRGNSC